MATLIIIGVAIYVAYRGVDIIERELGPAPDYEEFVPRPGELWINLLPPTIEIPPQQTYEARFRVNTRRMRAAHIAGSFSVAAGSSGGIEFILADDKNYRKWKTKLPASFLYSNTGSRDEFDVRFPASGTYHLVFVNAAASEKSITCDAKLEYGRSAK